MIKEFLLHRGSDETADEIIDRKLQALLDGLAPPYILLPRDDPARRKYLCSQARLEDPIDPRISLLCATSGTTGQPKLSEIRFENIIASIEATQQTLGSGQWLSVLPPYHIGGFLVLLRSLRAGYPAIRLPGRGRLTIQNFVEVFSRFTARERFVSLVPAQLSLLLTSNTAISLLQKMTQILVGGSAISETTRKIVEQHQLPITYSYGSSETTGGCVYSGVPLLGTSVKIRPVFPKSYDNSGQIIISGPTVVQSYRNVSHAQEFSTPNTFITQDIGVIKNDKLNVIGRIDECISSGSILVLPSDIENVIRRTMNMHNVHLIGIPESRFENILILVLDSHNMVNDTDPKSTVAAIRKVISEALGQEIIIRYVVSSPHIPLNEMGKLNLFLIKKTLLSILPTLATDTITSVHFLSS